AWGVGATALFIPPAVLMGFVLWRHHGRVIAGARSSHAATGKDRWGMFGVLTAVEVVRSTIFIGIDTFVALYWIRHLGSSPGLGGTALTLVLVGGVVGTLLGGRLGDRIGMVRTVQIGNVLLVPALFGMLACGNAIGALPLVFLVGVVTNIPFAVLIKLGQDYLPARPGTAAGVTLGLAVSAGGLFMPVLGWIADRHGPEGALYTLALIPLAAIALSLFLREPEAH
ncbi:MAG TPA: MFS transporter, partial [Mycobacterium sp.]